MSIEYYELINTNVISVSEIAFARTAGLYNAVNKFKEYEFVELRALCREGVVDVEYLIVDVSCDQVPTRSKTGVLYRERLAFEVNKDTNILVYVLALRKGFPILLHQNQTRVGSPAQLCLYTESSENILRTLTPEKFLKRVLWWLGGSASGDLHSSSQPVEGLFFESKAELVLPNNFKELKEKSSAFSLFLSNVRTEGGYTVLVRPDEDPIINSHKKVDIITIDLPPITHSQCEQAPGNLGELSDLLEAKGIDFPALLKDELKVNEKGVEASHFNDVSVILMSAPIRRNDKSEIERIDYHAFALKLGKFQLGVDADFLFSSDGKVFFNANLVGSGNTKVSLPSKVCHYTLEKMTVLSYNSKFKARVRSAISSEGPKKGMLIGAGALGGVLLDLWARSGWGDWSVVDSDHIKPHNLARHLGMWFSVGVPKVEVVANHVDLATDGVTKIDTIYADACKLENAELQSAYEKAELVIDASTSVNYPRLISQKHHLARHISVFITPNGNSCVFMSEDAGRSKTLLTLEAQYYRALINKMLGSHDLASTDGSFVSGSGCRDISFIMPYSRIVGHASLLAEEIISQANDNSSKIQVWNKAENGSINSHSLETFEANCIEQKDWKIYIDEGLIFKLKELRSESLPNETGGVLVGYHDFQINSIVVVDALPAPQGSISSKKAFERGATDIGDIIKITGGMVSYIGEWHSHPSNQSSNPSSLDIKQLDYLASNMADDGLPAISVIIGEGDYSVLLKEVS